MQEGPFIHDIVAAQNRLADVLDPTPLQRSRTLGTRVGAACYLKPENLQRTGSFKFRGAYNAVAMQTPDIKARGVIAYSSGNHGQAVACAAQLLGIPATIVMPENAIAAKVAAVEAYGGRIVRAGTTSEDRQEMAEAIAAREHLGIIPPYNYAPVIAGQGTIGLEILAQLPECDAVLVPVGGGGLVSGIALAVRTLKPGAKVIGVEPERADDARQSLAAGRIVSTKPDTIADGLRTSHVGELPFAIIKEYVTDIVTVSEDAIFEAMGFLARRCKLAVEPSGAVTVAALLSAAYVPGGTTVAVLSGGNFSPDALARALEG